MFFKNVIEQLKVNKCNGGINIKYYSLLAFLFMIYGWNDYIDIMVVIFVAILFILYIDNEEFIYSYFPIVFFEAVLVIPIIGGSFFRIYQMVFLIRVIREILKLERRTIDVKITINLIALIVFFGSSVLYINDISGIVSSILNAAILFYMYTQFIHKKGNEAYSQILAIVGFFVCFSGIYGLMYGTGIDYGYTMRISATIGDPNYSSLFYTLGMFSILGTQSISNKLKILLFSIIFVLLMLTVSMSGIFGTLLLLIIYISVINYRKALVIVGTMITCFLVFLKVKFAYGSTLFGIQFRILQMIKSQDITYITSGRSNLIVEYAKLFCAQPLIRQIFGGTNTISGDFRDALVEAFDYVSHNSYIDMLYMIGIVGAVAIVGLFIQMIRDNLKLYRVSNNTTYLSLAFLKLTILYYAFSLSIFPFRYFYTFFVL